MRMLALALCLAAPASAAPRDAAPPDAAPRALDPLLAGLYVSHFSFSTCPCCPTPTHAVVAGIYERVPEAAAALAGIPAGRLPLGYPLVVHSSELGLADTSRAGVVSSWGCSPARRARRRGASNWGPRGPVPPSWP